jgi:hypothetical protein
MDREGNKRRTEAQFHAAIQACLEKVASGFFRKSQRE